MFPRMVKNRVMVLPDEMEEKTEGGIVLPNPSDINDCDQEIASQTGRGEIVAKGKQANGLEVGDHVYFGQVVGMPIEHEGVQYLIMNDCDVKAVLV